MRFCEKCGGNARHMGPGDLLLIETRGRCSGCIAAELAERASYLDAELAELKADAEGLELPEHISELIGKLTRPLAAA